MKPSSLRFRCSLCVPVSLASALLGAACGPTELPAFANPPPYDAGADLLPDAASEQDAGDGPSR